MRIGKCNVIQFLIMLLTERPVSGFQVQQLEGLFGLASLTHSALMILQNLFDCLSENYQSQPSALELNNFLCL